jgi:hypothetical protein
MGLHNRYPSYFYKRGNLFNTHLSYSFDQSEQPAASRSTPRKAVRGQKLSPPVAKYPLDEFLEFVQLAMSVAQANQLLLLIAVAKNIRVVPSKKPMQALRRFGSKHLTQDEVVMYLTELRRRRDAHQPLLRERPLHRQRSAAPIQSESRLG